MSPRYVLVAEDNLIHQILTRAALESRGIRVRVVTDGDEAVVAALSGVFDAAFIDLQMPRMDGLEATRRIRAAEPGHLPIVAVTAATTPQDRQDCLGAGMDDFLPKPWSTQELTDVLARVEQLIAAAETAVREGGRRPRLFPRPRPQGGR